MSSDTDLDSLRELVDRVDKGPCLRVVELIKESNAERTELAQDGQGRLLVRKFIVLDDAFGHPYLRLKELESPSLPRVYSAEVVEDTLVVVMEYLEGVTLRERIGQLGPMTLPEAAGVLAGVMDGLEELHSMDPPIIHRDVNPSNIIIGAQGGRLIDFGIARDWREGSERDTHLWGTTGYAAPEQFGFMQTDVRTDVYALGATLRCMLMGSLGNPLDEVHDPRARNIVEKAMAFDPADRYASVGEMRKAMLLSDRPEEEAASAKGRVWRISQLVVGILCGFMALGLVGPIFDTGTSQSTYKATAVAIALFWFVLPYLLIFDPAGVRRRITFFQTNAAIKVAMVVMAGLLVSIAIALLDSGV